ncbi:MAG: GTP-binding protein [Candidatus Lokiarchaeota archaeon]|nr:GTP-binding protein [Candidatus Lokiarchaeota archaeon]
MSQQTDQKRQYLFKIVVVGDGGVGKSTMIQRLITGNFVPMKITIGTDLASYDMQYEDISVKLQIWDFAGERRFRFFLPNYARGAQGCLLCYDITRYTSFQNLKEWYDIVKENTKTDTVFVLVGGKADLASYRRTVKQEEAEELQNELDIPYIIETSSKTGENNKNVFEMLAEAMLKKRELL